MSLVLHPGGRRAICHSTVDTRSGFLWKRPLCSLGSGTASLGFGLAFISSFELRMTPPQGLPFTPSTWPSAAFFVFIIKGKGRGDQIAEEKEREGKGPFPRSAPYPAPQNLLLLQFPVGLSGKACHVCLSTSWSAGQRSNLRLKRRKRGKRRKGKERREMEKYYFSAHSFFYSMMFF